MRQTNGDRLPPDLERVAERLREERPEASPLDLDRIKTRAISQAAKSPPMKGPLMKSRLVSILVAAGILFAGAGGVMAATGGIPGNAGSTSSAAKGQYCPPNSPSPGKPKHHGGGNKCGHH
jgi:hypothetical protein